MEKGRSGEEARVKGQADAEREREKGL